ncbi:MAG TPA: TonB family protein [Polyangia bacterium]|nr:TonB family protein [Polyangia bacterium]
MRLLGTLPALLLTVVVPPANARAASGAAVLAEAAPAFQPPRLTHFVEAKPPPMGSRTEAQVVLTIDVDEAGHVASVEVAQPAGGPGGDALDRAAVEAARQFVFEPGRADGKPVPVRITYGYKFVLKPQAPATPPASAAASAAQPGLPTVPVSGIVRKRGDRSPVEGIAAIVQVAPGDERRALTGPDGRFAFPALPVGHRTLELRGSNIVPASAPIDLHEGKALELTTFVDVKERYASTVRGRRLMLEAVEHTLVNEEIRRIPGTQGDTLKAVQNLPGVARAPFGIGLLPVWGSAPQDTRVYVDGVDIPLLYHFGGLRSTVNSEFVQSLTFVPGAYQADHGLGLGGIVEVEARRPRTDGFHGFAQMDLLDGSVMIEGPITKTVSFAVAGRRSWIDATLPLFTTSTFQLSPVYYDYQARLTWRPSPRTDADLFLFGSDDRLSLLARVKNNALDAAVASHTYFHRLAGEWARRFDQGRTLSVVASLGYDAPFGLGVQYGTVPTTIQERSLNYNTRAIGRWPLGDLLRLDGGVDFEGNRWVVDRTGSPFTVTDVVSGTSNQGVGSNGGFSGTGSGYTTDHLILYTNHVAPFAGVTLSLIGKRLTIVPQFRLQVMTFLGYQGTPEAFARGYVSPEPRLTVRYQLTPRWAVRGAIGLYAQPPDPTAFSRPFGNPFVVPEKGAQAVLGGEVDPRAGLHIEFDAFYKWLRDLVVPSETGDPVLNNDGRGRAYGAEIMVRQELTQRFFGWFVYTFSRSERQDHPDQGWYLFQFDQTHILTLILSWNLPRGFVLGGRFRYVTGDPYTPVTGAFYDSITDHYTPLNGATNSARLDAFNQLDLRVDKIFTFDRWRFSIYLDVQNVLRASNPEAVGYNYDYRISHPITGLPLLPILGVRGDF